RRNSTGISTPTNSVLSVSNAQPSTSLTRSNGHLPMPKNSPSTCTPSSADRHRQLPDTISLSRRRRAFPRSGHSPALTCPRTSSRLTLTPLTTLWTGSRRKPFAPELVSMAWLRSTSTTASSPHVSVITSPVLVSRNFTMTSLLLTRSKVRTAGGGPSTVLSSTSRQLPPARSTTHV